MKQKIIQIKNELISKAGEAFTNAVKITMNNSKAFDTYQKIKNKYESLPKDAIVDILIRNACRKTKWEGFGNGLAVTGFEAVVSIPAPEVSHKILSASGAIALLLGDLTWATKIQIQLLLEIAQVYECPFDPEDEDDAYLVFKAALGMKGTERIGSYGRFIFTETARKQFRTLLRTGIRKAIQDRIIKIAGPKVGKLLGEKYLLKLIPLANAGIGYYLNNTITKNVGKWAKIRAKIRSSAFKMLDFIKLEEEQTMVCVLPVVFYTGTANDTLTENSLSLYQQLNKRANLNEAQIKLSDIIMDNDNFEDLLRIEIGKITKDGVKKALMDIAITSAAVNLEENKASHDSLSRIADWLQIEYNSVKLAEKIKHIQQ